MSGSQFHFTERQKPGFFEKPGFFTFRCGYRRRRCLPSHVFTSREASGDVTRSVSEGERSRQLRIRFVLMRPPSLTLRVSSGFATLLIVCSLISGCSPQAAPASKLLPREIPTKLEQLSIARFSLDGERLAVGSASGKVLVWKNLDDPPKELPAGRTSPLVSLTWSVEGLLAVSDLDRGLIGWEFGKREPSPTELPGMPTPAVSVAFRPGVQKPEMVVGMKDGSLLFLDQNGTQQLKPDHRGSVKQVIYSNDGRWLITAGADGQLIWRDATTRQIAWKLKDHKTEVSRLLLSRDGKQIVSTDWDGQIYLWDVATQKKPIQSFEQGDAVSGLDWSKGKLVSGGWDGAIKVWDAATGTCLRTLTTGLPIHDLTADPRSNRVVTVHLDRSLRLWELTD